MYGGRWQRRERWGPDPPSYLPHGSCWGSRIGRPARSRIGRFRINPRTRLEQGPHRSPLPRPREPSCSREPSYQKARGAGGAGCGGLPALGASEGGFKPLPPLLSRSFSPSCRGCSLPLAKAVPSCLLSRQSSRVEFCCCSSSSLGVFITGRPGSLRFQRPP